MIITVNIFIQVLALVLLLLAGLKVPEHPRFSFGWLGMFLWLLSVLIRL